MKNEEVKLVYDTLLCSPGMNEQIKIDFKISRKTILLIHEVIENGLDTAAERKGIIESVEEEAIKAVTNLMEAILDKADLKILAMKLNQLRA